MKIYCLIIFLFFTLSLSFSDSNEDKSYNNPQIKKTKEQTSFQIQENDDYKVEDDDFYYESDFFRRKIYQKKLPPLSNKEKIIWSFRMANKNLFL
jgi:hypothetical protein